MRNTVLFPLALLAACGSGGTGAGQGGQTAGEQPAEAPAAAPAAALAAAPPAFTMCRTCHTVTAGQNGIGPSLFGIVGSKAGDVPNFGFSPALKASGIVWSPEKLDQWLQGPTKMVPGTRMVAQVPDAASRKAIIDYLATLK